MSCPDLRSLSQLIDRELPETEAAPLRAHLATCTECGPRAERLRGYTSRLSATAAATALGARATTGHDAADPAAGCLSPSQIAAFLDVGAPAPERAAVLAHVERCNGCLAQAMAAQQLMRSLQEGPRVATPRPLQARVASRWADSAAPAPAAAGETALTSLVIRVTRRTAELVERHVVAPLRDLVELPMAMPAMRADETTSAVRFELQAPSARIRATVVPAGDAVGLSLALESDAGDRLADQRVFLRRHGRSIFSARTDAAGALELPGLERGVYEVSCPGIGAAFRIDLRD